MEEECRNFSQKWKFYEELFPIVNLERCSVEVKKISEGAKYFMILFAIDLQKRILGVASFLVTTFSVDIYF